MHRIATMPKHRGWVTTLFVVPLACLALGACGSSSSSTSSNGGASSSSTAPTTTQSASTSTSSPNPASTGTTSTSTTAANPTESLKRLYDCLTRAGIKLPPFKDLGKVKIDTTTPRYQAALKKCEQEG